MPRPRGAGTDPGEAGDAPGRGRACPERDGRLARPRRACLLSELKAVLETAFKLRRRSDSALGAKHLLLGLLADDGSAAGRIMRAAGAEFETACRMGFLVPGGERGFLLATSPWLARP